MRPREKFVAIALDPRSVMHLVDQLTEDETAELLAYAEESVNEFEFVTRASAWLIRKFGHERTHEVH